MKKKLLFVIPSLQSGGAEKSLVTLLQVMDYSQYDVDLFLFRREGLFLPLIPPEVRILDAGEDYRMFDGHAKTAVRYFLANRKPFKALRRVRYAWAMASLSKHGMKRAWRHLSAVTPKLKGYDTAIAYLEGTSTYFVIDRVEAKKKIAYLHIDYDFISRRQSFDKRYYQKIDALVSVSEGCCEKALQYFPFLDGKVLYMANIVSPTLIRKMAQQETDVPFESGEISLLTVGRLAEQKRMDRALRACAILCQRGLPVRWYVIGVGPLEQDLRALAVTMGVEDRFILLGEQSNPYPFIRGCDIYVQTSQFEGKSIAIDEAKCLAKPIVVTNFETVFDQIRDGENGLIVSMDPESIASAVEQLIRSPEMRETLAQNLRQEKVGTENEIQKLYAIL